MSELEWLKFTNRSPGGLPDGSGFYYGRYPAAGRRAHSSALAEPATRRRVFDHRLGTPPGRRFREVYARPDHPDWGFRPQVSHDGRHLVIEVWLGTDERNQVVYQDLADAGRGSPETLVERFDARLHLRRQRRPWRVVLPHQCQDAPRVPAGGLVGPLRPCPLAAGARGRP
ncbi:MAG: hypothetical protein U5Q16_01535 [Gammaproteobacteria bacterium]|nr:hypothetical protein [Gammaproteobacteria bacterium]